MKIFIDTNKYLDFYRASDHSLVVINTLIDLIEAGKVELIVPKQVSDEFLRDKDLIFNNFVQENFKKINIPGFLSGDKKISRVNLVINKIKLDYEKKFYSPKSKINIAFKKLFSLSITKEENTEILCLAHYRTLRGNPPRKDNRSFGDAIIWETLLKHFSNEDIAIISGDGDFSSEINKLQINPFLKEEWFSKHKKRAILYPSLGKFINEITKDKNKIKKEVIEEEASLGVFNTDNIRLWSNQNNIILNQESQNVFPLTLSSISANTYCQCCGKAIENNGILSIYTNNKCKDCSDLFSVPKNCGKCGKHFHESYSSTSISLNQIYLYGSLCPDCKK